MLFRASSIFALACPWSGLAALIDDDDAPPTLPDVDNLMKDAFDTVSLFNTQASEVQHLVIAQQEASRESIDAQKEEFEGELMKMKQNSSGMTAANDKLRTAITQLRQGNEHLLKHAERLQRGSTLMRDALSALLGKVAVARTFITDSLNKTNLTKLSALKVLDPPTPEPTLEHFLSVARGSLETTKNSVTQSAVAEVLEDQERSDRMSLLEMSSKGLKVRKAKRLQHAPENKTAEELVETLSNSITDLGEAQEQGFTEMQAHFIALSEVNTKRCDALVAEQQSLNQTRTEMVTLQDQLHTAKTHLHNTIEDLKQRLNGIRLFAQSANKTAADAMTQARAKHPANITSARAATSLLSTMDGMSFKLPSMVSATSHTGL